MASASERWVVHWVDFRCVIFFALLFCSESHALDYFELLLFFYDGKGEEIERVVRVCVVETGMEILRAPPDKVLQFSRTHFLR